MGTRLLFVDDEEAILLGMRDYFELLGYEVDLARCLAQARSLLEANDYSLVIADLRLSLEGEADGLDLAAEVRRHAPATRTVLLTAFGSPEVEARARRAGIDALVQKPQRLAEIAAIVRRLSPAPACARPQAECGPD